MAATAVEPAASVRRVRTLTLPVVARWLEVKPHTVWGWIQDPDPLRRLPALNIGTRGKRASYRIFRKDLVLFLQRRGMALDRIQELFGERSSQ
jgi:hypothetical protein